MYRVYSALIIVICLMASRSVLAEIKTGTITLKERKLSEHASPTATLGKKISVACDFHIIEFFGEKVVSVGATVKNTTTAPMWFSYNVALFDADDKLLGCVSQQSGGDGLKPKEETQLGSCLISMPPEQMAKVKTYQITFYESEKKIGEN